MFGLRLKLHLDDLGDVVVLAVRGFEHLAHGLVLLDDLLGAPRQEVGRDHPDVREVDEARVDVEEAVPRAGLPQGEQDVRPPKGLGDWPHQLRPQSDDAESSQDPHSAGLRHEGAERQCGAYAPHGAKHAHPPAHHGQLVPEAELHPLRLLRGEGRLAGGDRGVEEDPAHQHVQHGGGRACHEHHPDHLRLERHGEELRDEHHRCAVERRDVLRHGRLDGQHQARNDQQNRHVEHMQEEAVVLGRPRVIQDYLLAWHRLLEALQEQLRARPFGPLHPLDHGEHRPQLLLAELGAVPELPRLALQVIHAGRRVV
mmetsp:Transcript_69423/g.212811  ORF Transcript_69423/g.212811 Transcript_69423/m.212811 type:complete len:313 (+) Transcript_69423:56-994(+)